MGRGYGGGGTFIFFDCEVRPLHHHHYPYSHCRRHRHRSYHASWNSSARCDADTSLQLFVRGSLQSMLLVIPMIPFCNEW